MNLSKMRDMCEAYLDQSDFLIAVRDATTLIEEFGLYIIDFINFILDSLNRQITYWIR